MTATSISASDAAAIAALRHESRSQRISPQARDHAPGWPRPHYLGEDGKPKYVQWIGDAASAQIMSCSNDRTLTAGKNFACSCCGHVMEQGLLLDVEAHRGIHYEGIDATGLSSPSYETSMRLLDEYDGNYGSPLCYRCAVFALTQCPHFASLDAHFGGDLRWRVVTSPADYEEYDETSLIVATDREALPQITTAEVRAEVRAKRLHLTDVLVTSFPLVIRPADGTFEDWANEVSEDEGA